MYVIVVYDVAEKRVSKVCKCLCQYLHWVQNSVFEGEVTQAKLREIQSAVRHVTDSKQDSILFYIVPDGARWNREVIGIEKLEPGNFL